MGGWSAAVSIVWIAGVVISALLAEGWAAADADEGVQLWNVGPEAVDLAGWALDDGEGRAVFDGGARLDTGEWAWVARDPGAFASTFGKAAQWCFGAGCAMRTAGGGPRLADGGDGLRLLDPAGRVVDAMIWGAGDAEIAEAGWEGPPVQVYGGARGQVLHRKLTPFGPTVDRDLALDWASDRRDKILGRRIRWPGWDLEGRVLPRRSLSRATLELAVAPDGLEAFLRRHWSSAQRSIDVLAYSFDHPRLAEVLAERARSGVRVRVLLDGSPVGGVEPDQRWCLATMAAAGVELWWMDRGGGARRYRSAHAKLVVVDGLWTMVGTENPSSASAPEGGGATGRRGAWLATDAPAILAWAAGIVARDLDPAHPDLQPWQARDPRRGAPAPGYRPERHVPGEGDKGGRWRETLRDRGVRPVEMISAPENALAAEGGLFALVAAAGAGDELRVAQMREPRWWGKPSEGAVALNPRLVAYVAAARRGSRVRVLLDGYFDDDDHWNSNAAAVAWLNEVAKEEGLSLEARLGNPAGQGLHAKLVLVRLAEEGEGSARPSSSTEDGPAWYRAAPGSGGRWLHLGSLNGSEAASKSNREIAIQVGSTRLHDRLAEVFDADWVGSAAARAWLPWVGGKP